MQWDEKANEEWHNWMLSEWIEERAPAYFWPLLRRAQAVPPEQLADWVETAWEARRITEEELIDAIGISLVVEGLHRREGRRILLGVEVARQGTAEHVERARRRTEILARALEEEVRPMVAAEALDSSGREAARRLGVAWARVVEEEGEMSLRFFAPEEISEEEETSGPDRPT